MLLFISQLSTHTMLYTRYNCFVVKHSTLFRFFVALINVPACYFPLISYVEFDVPCSGRNDDTKYSTVFNAKKKICEKLPVYCIQKMPKLFNFYLKQMLRQSNVYLRFYQRLSEPFPPFQCIFVFRTKHISSRKKIYGRYGLYTGSKNCLYYISFK